ncbi:substrate-binding periplasmic protein [Bdellovibrio sp. HCB288]|uniref:substrate-binding periplasmic protein n=1 Tax=Bdellovibrio sp. HCB288 TaxID=3394355 RepID=UPI0039B67976
MVRIWPFIFIWTLCLNMPSCAVAAVKCNRIFRVAVIQNEPLYYLDKNKKVTGVMLEVAQELHRRTGCSFDLIEMVRPSMVHRLRSGSVDLSVLTIKTDELDKAGGFIRVFKANRALILTPALKKKNYVLKDVLKDKNVLVGGLISSPAFLDENEVSLLKKQGRWRQYPDYESIFQSLKRDQIQAFVGSIMVSDFYFKKLGLSDFGFLIDRSKQSDAGFYYAKQLLTSHEVELLSSTLAQMLKDGFFQKVLSKYSSPYAVENEFVSIN